MIKDDRAPIAVSSDAFFFEKDKSECTLILGIGNYLMGDEGVGVHVIQQMADMDLPDHIDILDGGTGGFLLLGCFEAYARIIFVDATMDGKKEGSISLIQPRFASDFPSALTVHDVGLKDMVEAVYLMDKKPEMNLFTISIKEMKPMTIDLSLKVAEAIPLVINQIMELAREMQAKIV